MMRPKFFDYRDWTALDFETTGDLPEYALQPWSVRGRPSSLAIARKVDGRFAGTSSSARATPSEIWVMARKVLKPGAAIVGWNTAFDVAWLLSMGLRDEVRQVEWLDAMQLWRHLTRIPESDIPNARGRKQYDLKSAVAEFFPEYAGYGDNINFHPTTDAEWAALLKYNKLDTVLTLKLAELFWNKLRKNPAQLQCALIEAKAIPEVADSAVTGLYVDIEYGDTLGAELDAEIEERSAELAAIGLSQEVLASPTQLRTVLFDEWQLPVKNKTPKGEPSTDKEALFELAFLDERAALIQKYREAQVLRTKFLNKVMESCDYNGGLTTHPTANIYGTYTGRMTYSSFIGRNKDKRQTGFALHQMSGQDRYRKLIVPPSNFTLVEWDAAGQEYRFMAIKSEDETMLSLCEPGEDPHAYMGADVRADWGYRDLQREAKSGNKEAAHARKLGKVLNLSCQYRIGKDKFRSSARVKYGLDLGELEAESLRRQYYRTYPGVRAYWKRAIKEAKIEGYAETLGGRRVQLNGHWSDPARGWMLESAAINFPIQGTGADQKYLAIAVLKPLLTKYSGRFYFELHDGLYAIFPTKVAMKAAMEGRKLLSNMPYQRAWGWTPPIPLPWDVKVGPSWGELEEQE